MPNGIDLILADHQEVAELFARFDETGDGGVVGVIMDRLTIHDDAEHGALYPLVGAVLGDEDMVLEAANAHSAVKAQMDVVAALEGPPLVDAVAKLRALVETHVDDEEQRILPALADAATPAQLDGLGARILQIKQRVG
jgi:hemerythrin superfamily protein